MADDGTDDGGTTSTTPSWLTQIFGDGSKGGVFGGGGTNAMTLAGLAAALQQYHNAGKYAKTAQTASTMANPMGDRSYYVNQLAQSYKDPTQFLNEPGNTAAMKIAMDATSRSDAAKGYMGSGNMLRDLQDTAQTQNQTYLQKIREQLGQAAGVQFDPANGANMLMKGNDQEIQSQNSALSALMMPFMRQNSQTTINNGAGGGGAKEKWPGQNSGKAPPGWKQADWDQIKGNFTTQPGAPGGGGWNGTGDSQPGPGGDAPGSGGDQFDWDKYYNEHPELPRLDVDGNPVSDGGIPWWEDPTGLGGGGNLPDPSDGLANAGGSGDFWSWFTSTFGGN